MICLKYTRPEFFIIAKYIFLFHLHRNCLQILFKTGGKWLVKVCQAHYFSVVEEMKATCTFDTSHLSLHTQ